MKKLGSVFLFCFTFGFTAVIFYGKTESSCHCEASPVQLPFVPCSGRKKKNRRGGEALIHIGASYISKFRTVLYAESLRRIVKLCGL